MAFLSIIVPVYNVEKYLKECLESILVQTYTDFECILVDDGSKDESGAICDEYAKNDKRIKVVHKANGGLVSARKAGIAVATGVYIGYVDSDDYIDKYYFEKMTALICKYNADIAVCGINVVNNDKKILDEIKYDYLQFVNATEFDKLKEKTIYSGEWFSFGIHPSLCNKFIRKEIILNHQMEVEDSIQLGEDAACSYFCVMDAKSICFLNEPMYMYRMNEQSMTHLVDTHKYIKTVNVLDYMMNKIEKDKYEILRNQFFYYAAYMISTLIYLDLRDLSFKKICEKTDEYKYIRDSLCGEKIGQVYRELIIPKVVRNYIEFLMKTNRVNYYKANFSRLLEGLKRRIKKK